MIFLLSQTDKAPLDIAQEGKHEKCVELLANPVSASTKARARARVKLSARRRGLPYASCLCALVGPGGAGKTSLRHALQGKAFPGAPSTRGSECFELLVVDADRVDLFDLLEAPPMSRLEHALRCALATEQRSDFFVNRNQASLEDVVDGPGTYASRARAQRLLEMRKRELAQTTDASKLSVEIAPPSCKKSSLAASARCSTNRKVSLQVIPVQAHTSTWLTCFSLATCVRLAKQPMSFCPQNRYRSLQLKGINSTTR